MSDTKLAGSVYRKLVSDISTLYENARKALIEAYWNIGKRIVEVEQQGSVKAAYGSRLLQQLSEDLTRELGSGFSESQLAEMRRFYLAHKKIPPAGKLGWTHHVELLRVADDKKRKVLEARAIEKSLKRDELRELVRQELVRERVATNLAQRDTGHDPREAERGTGDVARGPELLVPVKGTLYTYRILDPRTVQPKEEGLLLLDLGFSCYRDLDAVTSRTFKPYDIVGSVKDKNGNYSIHAPRTTIHEGPNVSRAPVALGSDSLYTYKATVEKVVDGDTLRVVVDLGFNTRTRQYLRLRGIDCPEIDTPEGKLAADFVKKALTWSLPVRQAGVARGTCPGIVITSSRSDKYDRYLADIYFTDPQGREVCLNNSLLEAGLAVRMGE